MTLGCPPVMSDPSPVTTSLPSREARHSSSNKRLPRSDTRFPLYHFVSHKFTSSDWSIIPSRGMGPPSSDRRSLTSDAGITSFLPCTASVTRPADRLGLDHTLTYSSKCPKMGMAKQRDTRELELRGSCGHYAERGCTYGYPQGSWVNPELSSQSAEAVCVETGGLRRPSVTRVCTP